MDVCELGKTEVILEMPWLMVHNPEINWEIGEVRMTRCLSLCKWVSKKKIIEKRQTMIENENNLR